MTPLRLRVVKTEHSVHINSITWRRLTLFGWLWRHVCVCCQTEQLQLKLIQEKDLNDQLETEKAAMERQVLCVCVCVHFF